MAIAAVPATYRTSWDTLDVSDSLASAAADEPDWCALGASLQGAVERLPPRERHVVRRHYWDDANLDEAGAEIGISKSWASRLHARALQQLRTHVVRGFPGEIAERVGGRRRDSQ